MKPIQGLDPVALACELPAYGLLAGDVGTAVLVHGSGEAYEVKFVGYDGHTVALLTLDPSQHASLRHSRTIP